MPSQKKIALFISILCMMVVTNVFAYPFQQNLLLNSDFEVSSPASWETTENGTFSLVEAKYVSATHSAKTEMTSPGQGDWRQVVTGIDASIHYRFRAHIYATNVISGSHSAELQWFNQANQYLGKNVLASTTANQWVEIQTYVEATT